MQDEFQSFLRRPEHQPMMEALQRKQIMRGVKAQEIQHAKEFRAKVTTHLTIFSSDDPIMHASMRLLRHQKPLHAAWHAGA